MKKNLFVCLLFSINLSLISQPSDFTWTNRHYKTNILHKFNYISSLKDQKEQGTCNIFASVAAVEAMAEIYFNKNVASLDLSESYIYSKCCSYGCGSNAASVTRTLNFFISDGVIDDASLPFPTTPTDSVNNCYFRNLCYNPGTPAYRVKIPGFQLIQPTLDSSLQRAIMDHGPIIAQLNDEFSCVYHNIPCDVTHTVLIVGWKTIDSKINWYIKDSWPGDSTLEYHYFTIFDYDPTFYYIIPYLDGVEMSCEGNGCNIFNRSVPYDYDEDGFYNWGIGPKPSSLTNAPSKMDYNDDDASIISLDDNYNPQSAPTITVPLGPICSSGGTLVLNNLPSGFTATWSVSPSYNFTGETSGTGTTAYITPLATEIMKTCYIIFTIHETGTSWTKLYSNSFIINGPNPAQISTSVEDSYGGTPPNIAGIWFLCPNSTYYIYLNNNTNGNCNTYDYSWNTPSAWTQYYNYSNYVSIYTGNQPWGTVEVYAKTCCNTTSSVKIKTQYFSEDDCGDYLVIYPNPTSDRFTILFKDNFDLNAKDKSLEIFDLNYNSKYLFKEFLKENTIETSSWEEGYYYIRLIYNGRAFSSKIKISH